MIETDLHVREAEARARSAIAPRYIPHQPFLRQRMFLQLEGEEALYGGQASGGKSDTLLMGALTYVDVPGYAALLLRRTYADLSLPGALMERAAEWLKPTPAKWSGETKTWTFPSNATLTFGYLEAEIDKYRYQSAEFQYCVKRGTRILMADGSLKPIQELNTGERVMTLLGPRRIQRVVQVGMRPCVKTTGIGESAVVSLRHRLLTPNGWASPQELIPKQSRGAHKFDVALGGRFRDYRTLAEIRSWGHWRERSQSSPSLEGTGHQERCASLANGGNDHAGFEDEHQAVERPQEWSARVTLLARVLQVDRSDIANEHLQRAPYRAHFGSRIGVIRHNGYRAGYEICDGQSPQGQEVVGGNIPQRDDAEEWHRSFVRMDDLGSIPEYNLDQTATFDHPYTNLPQHSNEDVFSSEIRMRQVGEQQVWDLKVEGASHYIIHNGLISVNCGFDELTQFSDTQYTYLFSRLRRPRMPCVLCGHALQMTASGIWVHDATETEKEEAPRHEHEPEPDIIIAKQYPRSKERNLSIFQVPLVMRSGTNPGGFGAEWVRNRFIPDDFLPEHAVEPRVWEKDAAIENEETKDTEIVHTFFVPSRKDDNPYADKTTYEKSLSKLGYVERRQLGAGDWSITATGRMRFDPQAIGKFEPVAATDGELFMEEDPSGRLIPMFRPRRNGIVAIWKRPQPGHLYVIGADTAQGRDVNRGEGTAKGDFSVDQVRDLETGEQVARLRARITERAHAQQLYMLARWFNNAFVVPEIAGGYGTAMLDHLVLDLLYPIGNVYRRKGGKRAVSQTTPELDDFGFSTGPTTKPQLVSGLDSAILFHAIETYDAITINEYKSFEVDKNGQTGARQGCFDDCVIADALCVLGIGEFPSTLRVQANKTRPRIVQYAVGRGGRVGGLSNEERARLEQLEREERARRM